MGFERAHDKRFHAALRMDPLINDWENVAKREGFKDATAARKFLDEWIRQMNPLYMAVSLPTTSVTPTIRRVPWYCAMLSFRLRRRTICRLR